MPLDSWLTARTTPPEDGDEVWELFHENSKVGRYDSFLPNEVVAQRMLTLAESLEYEGCPIVALPAPHTQLDLSLTDAIVGRVTPAEMRPEALATEQLATLLYYAYGLNRTNAAGQFPRPFRVAPSGGGLYPLELYVVTKWVDGVPAGILHYSPVHHHLRLVSKGDFSASLANALVGFQAHVALDASLILVLTALFERSTFKYGPRGYRFVLLEAGHVAQNVNLVSTAMGLGCKNLGGYHDREVDALLGLDGVHHSTVYMVAIGSTAKRFEEPHRVLPGSAGDAGSAP